MKVNIQTCIRRICICVSSHL